MRIIILFCSILLFSISSQVCFSQTKHFSLQLKWHHQFQFAGYYMAKEKGYYSELGLTVDILDVKLDSTSTKEVLSGRADFGIDTSGVLAEYHKGHPIVVVAAILQKSPLVFIVKGDSGIQHIKDIAGKKVMMFQGTHSMELYALLKKYNLLDKIEIIEPSYNIGDLITGNVDAFNGYLSNEPYVLESNKIPYRVVFPSEFGINFYGDLLFTNKKMIEQYPKEVERFKKATIKGWQYAIAHPEETIDIIKNIYGSSKTKSQLRYEANTIRQLMEVDLVEIGYINEKRLEQIADTMQDMGLIKNRKPLSPFIYKSPQKIEWDRLLPFISLTLLLIILLLFWRYYTLYKANIVIQRQERRLLQQSKMAALGEMLSSMSHQLKQPLNSMYLLFQYMEEFKDDSEKAFSRLDLGKEMVEHMSQTIDDFKNYYREDKVQKEFNIPEVVKQTLFLSGGYLAHYGIQCQMSCTCNDHSFSLSDPDSNDVDVDCSATLYGSPSELKQALLNLIQNSRDALSSQKDKLDGLIYVVLEKTDSSFIIKVYDNGPGIPSEDMKSLFQKNFTRKDDGTGIGLYMTKMIIEEAFSGQIEAYNQEEGAVFLIRLPLLSEP